MNRVLKVIVITLLLLILVGSSGYLFYKNITLNKSYEAATQQVTQLQAKLNAVGTFADVFTVRTSVKMGQEIKEEDLILQTVPTSSVPSNVITNKQSLIGNYFRIEMEPGVPITADFVVSDKYIGSVYERDIFLDSLPIGTTVGDYIDIRVVLPGGEEFVIFPHKRINARFENAVKMKLDEADLWLYTSMMVDRSLYKDVGFKIYATKYVDPGAHDKTVAYYPVRKEVVDIMNISGNLTDIQKARMFNDNLRTSIDTKLSFYADPLNRDSSKIATGVGEEESRHRQAQSYYETTLREINQNPGLVNPNSNNNSGSTPIGDLGNGDNIGAPTVDGVTDGLGNNSVIKSQDYLDNLGGNLFDDESPVQ